MSLKCDPQYMEAVENLAFIYFEKNDDVNATSLYERLVESRPNDADVHSSLSILYQRNGLMEKAEYVHEPHSAPCRSLTPHRAGNIAIWRSS
jgi:Tfp pilus assembly protein PilF